MSTLLNWINAHAKGLAAGYGSAATALYPVYGHQTWFIWVIAGGAVLGVTGITNTPTAAASSASSSSAPALQSIVLHTTADGPSPANAIASPTGAQPPAITSSS